MTVGGLTQITSLSYSLFYFPAFALGYLRSIGDLTGVVSFLGVSVNLNNEFTFGILFFGALLGGMINHAVNISLFGPEGPQQNPKHSLVVLYHKYAVFFSKSPSRFPRSPQELEDRMINYLSEMRSMTLAIRRIIRLISMLAIGVIFTVVTWGLIVLLGRQLLNNTLAFPGLIFLMGILFFKFRGWIFNRYATPVPTNSAEWIYVQEHQRSPTLSDTGEIKLQYVPDNWPSAEEFLNDLEPDEDIESSYVTQPEKEKKG